MDDEVESPLDELEAMDDIQDDDLGDGARSHVTNCGASVQTGGNQRN